ncbi:SPT3 Dosage dependent suppressor of Ty-induced promoter mutations-like protein [Saxophila tyrrhenica]|uniref:SPT3 Dosage dependent suppressor of Ty-induced promoter mutations-like protein n=1 Tax=Saxophila tyrrhenica TaxID=1690608 RepID=A0AAV9PGK6_9PEZI|nr:SPT3 Dosage dependent suppressor of Ty-induced promoter mutations-like protein [Saxophila tyrrhenica]
MDGRNLSFGGDGIDWSDPAFSSAEFQDSLVAESPWGNSALNDFTNLADYSDSPGFGLRTPSKSGPDAMAVAGAQQAPPTLQQMPTESSQDSSSDSSSRRKRKSASDSPMPDGSAADSKMQDTASPGPSSYQTTPVYEQSYGRRMPNLAIEQSISDNGDDMFNFNSTASSPNLPRDFNQQMTLNANMAIRRAPGAPPHIQESPATINPGMFTVGPSRDQSPAANNVMFGTASPNAIFSTPSSDSNDFAVNTNWNANINQNPAWPSEFNNQFASPGLAFTPSPVANGGTPSVATRAVAPRNGRSPLHVAPISTKSRVETQINVVMTLEKPQPGFDHLHLPLHTIAKSKLLAKEDYDKSKVLELHTMLVCTSAMHNATMKEKALRRAAAQDNADIQRKAEMHREEDLNRVEIKGEDDEDRPANGGEVKICTNCIQRERKRAGRKKLKKEEEQQHWERYETERVVVFNSNEYLPFKPAEQMQQPQPQRDGAVVQDEAYVPPEGAISVQAQMRIACYCRHQSEKEGFQVIFTMKDQHGTVVAQQISDSILITDDHKTHPPQLTTMSSELLYNHPQLSQNGLQTSYSMVDLQPHSQPFTSSRSAGNLQALGYSQQPQFNPHSHVHQLPNNGYASQATSATMTPTSLSRPGSPSSAGQVGPNKKRKSSSFHKRLPSGLQMTPRVDTNQPSSANALSGVTMSSNFSPTGTGFAQNDPSFMTIPNNAAPAQYFGSNPSTPANEHPGFAFGAHHQLEMSRPHNNAAYFSHPSSAVPSRSNSPVLQHGRNLSGYAPGRAPLQAANSQLNRTTQQFYGGLPAASPAEEDEPPRPVITKITPNSGPSIGGTEVSVFGYNFTQATSIMFGDIVAPTTFYGEQCLLVGSPPGHGQVRVRIANAHAPRHSQFMASQMQSHVFTYVEGDRQAMELALQYLSQRETGDAGRWVQWTNELAHQLTGTNISGAGMQGQGYGGG